jgi:hypothetical protein
LTGEWRTLHSEELCAVYLSSYINLVIKSRSEMARTGEARTGNLVGDPNEGEHFQDPGTDRRITFK